MSLTILPTENGDSFISILDADEVISRNSLQYSNWLDLSDLNKEIYLRIATTRILNVVSFDINSTSGYLNLAEYISIDSCLPKAAALMAIHDLAYGLSSEINPNTGLVSKEKVGDIEVNYFHGYIDKQVKGRITNPYPSSVVPCLNSYGSNISSSSIKQALLVRS